MENILVIIDVQKEFTACTPALVESIEKLITDETTVIYCLMPGPNQKVQPLIQCQAKTIIYSNHCDKSRLIRGKLCAHWPKVKKIRLCGVHTDACVYETAKGLMTAGYEIEISAHTCNSVNAYHHEKGLRLLKEIGCCLTFYDNK